MEWWIIGTRPECGSNSKRLAKEAGLDTATIKGSPTGLDAPAGIALDAAGHIYVSNLVAYPGSIRVYPAGLIGTVAPTPTATITGNATGLNNPLAIAF